MMMEVGITGQGSKESSALGSRPQLRLDDGAFFAPGEDSAYWISSKGTMIYHVYRGYNNVVNFRLVLGALDRESFMPTKTLKALVAAFGLPVRSRVGLPVELT